MVLGQIKIGERQAICGGLDKSSGIGFNNALFWSPYCTMYIVCSRIQFELHHDRFVSLTGFRTQTTPRP